MSNLNLFFTINSRLEMELLLNIDLQSIQKERIE
jgi:hypothetical protein